MDTQRAAKAPRVETQGAKWDTMLQEIAGVQQRAFTPRTSIWEKRKARINNQVIQELKAPAFEKNIIVRTLRGAWRPGPGPSVVAQRCYVALRSRIQAWTFLGPA